MRTLVQGKNSRKLELLSKCLMPKILEVRGNTARVCIKTVFSGTMIISVCFTGPGCSVVVL